VKLGIFAVDGGNATGLAWGIYDLHAKSVPEALSSREESGSVTTNRKIKRGGKTVVEGGQISDLDQIITIFMIFKEFRKLCEAHGAPCDLVVEDFILLPGSHAGGKDGVASVRIAWGLQGLVAGRMPKQEIVWQTPSQQGGVEDEYLRRHGVWIPGRDHERTCVKHIVVRLNKVLR